MAAHGRCVPTTVRPHGGAHRPRLVVAIILAILAMMGATAACSTLSSPPEPTRRASPAPPVTPGTGLPAVTVLPLPIEEYMFTPVQVWRANEARYRLAQQCMQSYGLTFTPPTLPPVTEATTIDRRNRRYGVTNIDQARVLGYHPPADVVDNDHQPLLINTLDPMQKLVYFGLPHDSPDNQPRPTYQGRTIPPGGCTATAAQQISPTGAYAHSQLTAQIDFESFRSSLHNPQLTAAFGQWSACMKHVGYDYPTTLAAVADHRWRTPAPTTTEITVAIADITCQHNTHLLDVWYQIESAYQHEQITDHQAQLVAIQQDKQRQLDLIKSVLGS